MSAKKYLKMPAQQPAQPAAKTEKEEQLWNALKRHIMRERERKKQELQAEVEEERLRREREEREKQDVMTLGETKEQILMLEKNLDELRNEKQQLFLQLKKVLNEDDNRKRQMKEEMFAIQNIPQQIFLPQRSMPPHQQQHMMHKVSQPEVMLSSERIFTDAYPNLQGNPQVNVGKRTHSPSPVQHVQGYYKQPNLNNQPYALPQKIEEGRRGGEVARAVLWNKSQYCPPVGFYPGAPPANPQDNRPPPQPQILYPYQSSLTIPMRQYVDIPSQPGPMVQPKPEQLIVSGKVGPLPPSQANLYHIPTLDHTVAAMHGQQPPMKTITIEKIPQERLVPYHIELVKHDERKDLRQLQGVPPQAQPPPGVVATHLTEGIVYAPSLRPAAIQMHTIATNQQLPKSGSITQGYPSARPPPISNPQQQPPPQMHYSRHRY
ncbi:stress response protein nst1 isoform X1 [Anopheles merus]|uniref:stress response protein nst1 isoform X1 n=1 Tax=Anopheles merus TaxID=30066 RepID=UPI001BE48C5F|nr:stress response protein nst1 isoform X1 [Anopheles merus]